MNLPNPLIYCFPVFVAVFCMQCDSILSNPDFSDESSCSVQTAGPYATAPIIDFQRSTYCYPNPASAGDTIYVQIAVLQGATMNLEILDLAEIPLVSITSAIQASGKYTYAWDLTGVEPGMYAALVTVDYENGSSSKKIMRIAVRSVVSG